MTGALALVYTLYGERGHAEAAARAAVTGNLAACANLLAPSRSFYRWKGLIEAQDEFPVLFKTAPDARAALMDWLAANHPYDTPAIVAWDADATPAFAEWASAAVVRSA